MKKKYLIIGPRLNEDLKTHGGTPVLVNQLLSYLKDEDRDFIFIETMYFGEKMKLLNYMHVLYLLFKSINKVDIVMVNVSSMGAYFLAPVVLLISKIFKKKFVFRRFAGNCIELYESSSLWRRKLMDYVIKYADILLYEPRYLVDYFSKKSTRVYWFPNSRLKSNIIRDPARPYQKKFIFLGEVRQGKGIDEILKASESLDETYTIDIYGTIHYDSKYSKDLFNNYANVNYRGIINHDDVYQKLSEYDVLLLPSYKEGYPGVIIEAFAAGLPIIATSLPSIKEMLDNKCSILIDTKNAEQLTNAITVFNDSNFEEYSRNSLKMFNNYEQKHVHEKFISICEEPVIKVLDSDKEIEVVLPILGQEAYMKAKSDNYGWFQSGFYVLPFILDKRAIFTRMVLMTEVIGRQEGLDVKNEEIFLNDIVNYIREHKMCDFIYKAQSNVIFNVCPKDAICVPWGTHIVDIDKSDDALMLSFKKRTRTKIRKAIKDGLTVEITDDVEMIYNLIKDTLERQKSIHYPSLKYLNTLNKDLAENTKFFIVLKDEELQGCATLVYDDHRGYMLYAGSISHPDVGALTLMHYEAMRHMRDLGVKIYDFVGTRLNIQEGSKFAGISQFKKSFNPTILEGYAFRLTINPMKYFFFSLVSKIYLKLKGYTYMDPIDRIINEEKQMKIDQIKGDISVKKIAIITSLDYELFGDGTGLVQREQIIPIAHLANICDLYGVKLTIMFEYGQYAAYSRYADKNPRLAEDNRRIEEQLVSLVKRGHDVQLHYHAQWYNAVYDEQNDRFSVDLSHVDFSSLAYKDMLSVLKEGKAFLEELLRPHKSDYKCIGFRAGSWAVRNENKLLTALKECGFKADSSVVPNTKFESEQVNFEYMNCPHYYHYWYIDKLLSKEGSTKNFVEIPPYTKKYRFAFLKYFNTKYFLSKKIVSSFYCTKISEKNFSIFQKMKKIITRDYYMADFNTMTYKTLIQMVEEVLDDTDFSNEKYIPIMFISHPKTTYNVDDLHLLFQYLEKKHGNRIEYWSYQQAIDYLVPKQYKDKN